MREAVFSSTGFRIRAAQGQAAEPVSPEHHFSNDSAKRGLAGLAKRAAATLFFTLFPADCRICDSPLIEVSRLPACETCLLALHPLSGAYCAVCGQNLPRRNNFETTNRDRDLNTDLNTDLSTGATTGLNSGLNININDPRCLLCQKVDPPFERAVAFGSYEDGLRDLIHLLKFHRVSPAARILGLKLASTIAALEKSMPVGTIVVVPVPLHKSKQAQRGFNQAEMISRSALKHLSRPKRFALDAKVLIRRRETSSQIGLTNHQRRENLRGAFTVTDPTKILKRDILLIDDVLTTGTTASECARVLVRAGAARVWVATVARTLKISDVISLSEHPSANLAEDRSPEGSSHNNDDSPDNNEVVSSEDVKRLAVLG